MIEGLCPEVVLGRIYSNWKTVESVPHEARLFGYGLDFGFDPDPAAIVAVYWYNGGYILDEKLYQTELLNEHLAATLNGCRKRLWWPTVPSPRASQSFEVIGSTSSHARRGKDSVDFGIKQVQGMRISYTRSSVNLHKEDEGYGWKINKDGETVGIEDPSRYALTMFAGSMYDPQLKDRERIEVSITRQKQGQNQSR
jgi:phage terminase large subunit